MPFRSGLFLYEPRVSYATPLSSTAILTPFPPGLPAENRLSHARGASTPVPGLKFHWSACHPAPLIPGSLGIHACAVAAMVRAKTVVSRARARMVVGTRVVREVTRVIGPIRLAIA